MHKSKVYKTSKNISKRNLAEKSDPVWDTSKARRGAKIMAVVGKSETGVVVGSSTDFPTWLSQCVLECCMTGIGIGYTFNLNDSDDWRELFEYGLSPEDAVQFYFCEN